MKLKCKILGKFTHKWRYFSNVNLFSGSILEFRVCKFCGHTQEYVKIVESYKEWKYVWINCIERTKQGAEEHFKRLDMSCTTQKEN